MSINDIELDRIVEEESDEDDINGHLQRIAMRMHNNDEERRM